MVGKRTSRRFAADNRAVSAVIGFILIFGILVLLLTVYQAQIVPQQNAQTEFEHFEDNKNEMIELRNAISTAGQADTPQFPSVTLGTSYQTRLLTINPAPPTGTLKTSEPYDITIDNGSHEETVSTRFLKYEPGYNELSIGTVWFENGVLYLDEREQSGFSVIEDQNLLRSNETLRVNALQNEFSETGTDRVTLELYPTEDIGEGDIPEGNLNVSLPTRLNESDYWGDAFEEDPDEVFDDVNESAFPEDDKVFALELDISDDDDLRLNTVGIQSTPEEEAPRQNVQSPGGGSGAGEDTVNFEVNIDETNSPVDEGDTLTVDVTVENTGGQTDVQNIELAMSIDEGNADEPDNPVDTKEVELAGSDSAQLTLEWEVDDDQTSGGSDANFDATVSSDDSSDSVVVTVEGEN